MKLKNWKGYNIIDAILLGSGLITIIVTSVIFNANWLIIVNSLLGILCVFMQAKGKIATQFIGIIWFVFYCFMSYQQKYYGETILYATIMIPLYIYGVIHWLANRDKKDNVVIVKNKINTIELAIFISIWSIVSIGVFFLLKVLNTAQLWLSTIAFCTMLPSVYLLIRRNKWNQLLFLINDVVLFILWQTLLYKGNYVFIPILCYQVFQIIYDIYGLFEWIKLEKQQNQSKIIKGDKMNFSICLVSRGGDLACCAKILREIYNNNVLNEGWTEETSLNTCKFFYKQNKDLFFIAKDENNNIIGFTYSFIKPWSNGNMLMIEEISVLENFRKHGIAKALLLAVVSKAKEKYKITNVCGEAYHDKNADWIPFDWYKRIGFSKNKELFIIEAEPQKIIDSLK